MCAAPRFGRTLALLVGVCAAIHAQTNTGSLRGFVYDETGAVIPGVTVRATDENRGVERETSTSATGEYVLSYVEPGILLSQL